MSELSRETRWRVGTKNPHALYKDDQPAGFLRDAEDAREIVEAMNAPRSLDEMSARLAQMPRAVDLERIEQGEALVRELEAEWLARKVAAEVAEQKLADANARIVLLEHALQVAGIVEERIKIAVHPAVPACEHDWCFASGPGELELCRECRVHR